MQTAEIANELRQTNSAARPRIALLTPYSGGNLGDAAIQDAMIANLRERMPQAQFLGITLDGCNFVRRHGDDAFPLLPGDLRAASKAAKPAIQFAPQSDSSTDAPVVEPVQPASRDSALRGMLRRIPGLRPLLKTASARFAALRMEWQHTRSAYRVLRRQDLLLISGGGQLDDEWGGSWELPYALFKWTLLARLARVPCAAASVGAGKIRSSASRLFFSMALRLCSYRSYREEKTRAIAAGLLRRAANDPIVPDVAFSLPVSAPVGPQSALRTLARGREIFAVSPIAFAKPVNWPTPDRAAYDRYVQQMALVLAGLVQRGYFVVLAWSSLGDDQSVIPDIFAAFDPAQRASLESQIHIPAIASWRDLVAALQSVDYLVASRLHSTILSFVARTPVVAISFDPKVDWVMEDLRLTDYLLHIRDFSAADVFDALDRLRSNRAAVVEKLTSYREGTLAVSARQYDEIAGLAARRSRTVR